jgi:L-malate glycosyltransferase
LPGVFLMIDSLQTGGSERQFVALSHSLDRSQFRVALGCIQAIGPLLEGLELDEFPLGGNLYGFRSWKTRMDLGRHMRRNSTCVAHAFDFYSNLTLAPAARLARIPVVIGSQRQLGDLLTPAQSRAQLMIFRWCDAVVCNSQAAAKRLIESGLPQSRTRVIWNGLAPELFKAAMPALPPRPGWLRVGMIARMNERVKNHSLLLRAAARLQATNPQVEFVLVGDGRLRPELEKEAASLGLCDHVKFLGDRRDIPAVLASLDLSVLSSDSESLSNAVIESMAAGVSVVATSVGANPELLADKRGMLVPAGDDAALAAALAKLLQDPSLRAQMGQNCRTFAQENFTLDKMRRSHEQLYLELLSRKGWKGQGPPPSSA